MSVIFQVICLASQATGPQLPHMGRAFTDVQEMRQVIWQAFVMGWEVGWTIIELNHELLICDGSRWPFLWWIPLALITPSTGQEAAGSHIVRCTLNELRPSTVATTILLDVLSHDGFPASAAMEEGYALSCCLYPLGSQWSQDIAEFQLISYWLVLYNIT